MALQYNVLLNYLIGLSELNTENSIFSESIRFFGLIGSIKVLKIKKIWYLYIKLFEKNLPSSIFIILAGGPEPDIFIFRLN